MFSVEPAWALLSRQLDACALRQAVYSTNLANASVAGYQPLDVDFESQLQAVGGLGAMSAAEQNDVLGSIQPEIVATAMGTIEPDQQLALMSKNALRYESLLGAFEHSIDLLRLAVQEGKA